MPHAIIETVRLQQKVRMNSSPQPGQDAERSHDHEPMFRIPTPVWILITYLVFFHLVPPIIISNWDAVQTFYFAFIPARISGDTVIAQVPGVGYTSMLTYAFLHAGWFHLITNCLWLAVFGTPVARCLGGFRFFLLAAVATVAGALASLLVHWGQYVVMVGASGAISGMLGASVPIMYAKGAVTRFRTMAPPETYSILPFQELLQNYRALWFMAIWLFFTLITGASQLIAQTAFLGASQIAWEAHLGGFIAGFAMIYLLVRQQVSSPDNV